MRHALAFAAATVLLFATRAAADIPLPKDLKYVDPRVAFEGVEKHRDYVFHLSFKTFTGGPGQTPFTRIEVNDAKPFNLNAQRRIIDFKVLAVERKAFERRAKDDPTLAWLTDKAEGVLAVELRTPSTVAKLDVKEVPVTAYRVAVKDGKLSAEPAAGVKGGPPRGAPSAAVIPPWVAGLGFAVGLTWLGLWWTWRG